MSRIRTIKPGFFRDLGIAGLPIGTRLTYIGLWTYVDDAGRGVDDARLVKAELWPLDDKYTLRIVARDLDALADLQRICRYTTDAGRCFLHVVRWGDHQKISHPQISRLAPCTNPEHAMNEPGTFMEPSRKNLVGREVEGEGNPPTPHRGGRRTASATNGRRPASEPEPVGGVATAVAERLRSEAAARAEACGKCDHGFIVTGRDNTVRRCDCQDPES